MGAVLQREGVGFGGMSEVRDGCAGGAGISGVCEMGWVSPTGGVVSFCFELCTSFSCTVDVAQLIELQLTSAQKICWVFSKENPRKQMHQS